MHHLEELKARGLAQRILIVTPANLTFQWQRERKHKFRENFEIADRRDFQERPLSFAIRPHPMAGKSSESTTQWPHIDIRHK
jgi:hypothetical protein